MSKTAWAHRIAALLLLTGLLFVISSDRPYSSTYVPSEPDAPMSEIEDMYLLPLKEDVHVVLLCDLSEGEDGVAAPSILQLIILREEGIEYVLSIPVGTRIPVSRPGGSAPIRYATLRDAYIEGAKEGLGYESLLASISRLLGGVPVRSVVSLTRPGMVALIDSLGGIRVRYDYYSAAAGGVVSGGIISPYSSGAYLDMRGTQVMDYMAGSLHSLTYDTGAMRRQQEALFGVCERLSMLEEPYTLERLFADTGGWAYASLALPREGMLEKALCALSADPDRESRMLTLWGEERVIDGAPYCLPDSMRIKQFVLDTFYESSATHKAAVDGEEGP